MVRGGLLSGGVSEVPPYPDIQSDCSVLSYGSEIFFKSGSDVNPPTNCGVLSLLPLLVSGAKPLQSLLRDRWTYKTASVQKLQHNLYDKLVY